MARSAFGNTYSDWLFNSVSYGTRQILALVAGTTTLTFWSAQSGGTQYTDLLDANLSPITQVVMSGYQIPRFYGPDNITGMWAQPVITGAPRFYMEARVITVGGFIEDPTDPGFGVPGNTSFTLVVSGEAINAKSAPYNAQGNGSADDLAAIQAAIDACSTAGGGMVFLPTGTYMISGRLDVKANVMLRGTGMTTTIIKSQSAATNPSVRLRGDNDVTLQDLTVDVNNRTNAIGVVVECASSSTVATRHVIRRVKIINSTNHAVRVQSNVTFDFAVEDCLIDTCEDGLTMFEVTGQQHINPRFKGNRFRNVGTAVGGEFSHAIQLFGTSPVKAFVGVEIIDNSMRDWTTVATAIPIEANHCDGVIISRNKILTVATRGIGCGDSHNVTIANNVIKAQTIYAMELGTMHGFSITGNVVEDCASFFWETDSLGMEDGVIANNIYRNSGLSSAPTGGNVMKLPWARRVQIRNNEFYDWEYLREAIRVGEAGIAEDITVESNQFYVFDANTTITAINLCKTVRSQARNNVIRIIRNLVAGDDYAGAIQLHNNTASADLLVESNEIVFEGTTSSAPNASGIGHNGNIAAFALTGTTIRNNRVMRGPIGVRLVINSTDMIVDRNETNTCTAADVIPATAIVRPISPNVQIFTANGTWTKPAGVTTVQVVAMGGGGSGGSGRRGAAGTIRTGGSAGGGGGRTVRLIPASVLSATESVVVGTAAAGGAAITADNTDGSAGNAGTSSTFKGSAFCFAGGGSAGLAGSTGGVAGSGGGGGQFSGATGGSSQSAGVGTNGNTAADSGGGGGGGGSITAADAVANGGAGGAVSSHNGGGGSAGASPGGAGGAGTSRDTNSSNGGGGGGGGASSITGAAGAGGNGGIYGGGGGGGGASLNGNNSGKGGDGGPGIVIVTSW